MKQKILFSEDKNLLAEQFQVIDQTIRQERLYIQSDLHRGKIISRFGIGRHRLNSILVTFANGQSFPQYINSIRMEEAYRLLCEHPQMTISEIAYRVGLKPANFRNQFRRIYGKNPRDVRRHH